MLPQIVTVNPMRHRRRIKNRHKRHSYRVKNRHRAHRRHHARTHHRRSRRRVSNPLKLPTIGGLKSALIPAVIGAGGAIGMDVGLAYASPYLPAFLQSGWGRIGAQVAGALAIGWVAGKAGGRETGKAVLAGALTITAYSALRQVLAPTVGTSIKGLSGLADFSDFSPTNWSGGYAVGAGMGAYMKRPGMGAYLTSENAPPRIGMGAYLRGVGAYMNPGSFLQKQRMGAYMPQGGFGGYDSDSM